MIVEAPMLVVGDDEQGLVESRPPPVVAGSLLLPPPVTAPLEPSLAEVESPQPKAAVPSKLPMACSARLRDSAACAALKYFLVIGDPVLAVGPKLSQDGLPSKMGASRSVPALPAPGGCCHTRYTLGS